MGADVAAMPVEQRPPPDRVLDRDHGRRDVVTAVGQMSGEHGAALVQQGRRELPRLQILTRQVLDQLPDPTFLLGQRARAHNRRGGPEVGMVRQVDTAPAQRSQPPLPRHQPVAAVDLFDEQRLQQPHRRDRRDQLGQIRRRRRVARIPRLR